MVDLLSPVSMSFRSVAAALAVSALLLSDASSAAVAVEPVGIESHTYLDALDAGDELFAGEELNSPDGTYRFAMQVDGNAVVYDQSGRPLWNSGTFGSELSITMQEDGNLVIYTPDGVPRWFSGTNGEPGSYLLLQDDGNLVVYRADETPSWGSRINGRIAPPPIFVLYSGESLMPGRELSSLISRNQRRAVMQLDGNFVFYGPRGVIWSSNTSGVGNRLDMQKDGNAVIYSPSGAVQWASGTNSPYSSLRLNHSNHLVIEDASDATVWSAEMQLVRNVLHTDEGLEPGAALISVNQQYRAIMQADGNFVLYSTVGPVWWTGGMTPGAQLYLSDLGHLRIDTPHNAPGQWAATSLPSWDRGAYVLLQDDGNLVEYDRGGVVWSSRFGPTRNSWDVP